MKKKIFWSGLVFVAVFLVCYFPISSGREVTDLVRASFSFFVGLAAALITWIIVNPEE